MLKILSKMGIATVDSYRGAQIVEAIGLAPEVIDLCFAGVVSTIGGLGWEALGADALAVHAAAELTNPGYYRDMKGGSEHHTHNKEAVDALHAASVARALDDMASAHLLQKALAGGNDEAYAAFATKVNTRPLTELRDLLDLKPAGPAVPLEEVEPAASIVQRFSTGAMSHGSLSREAHETLAQAMNLIGGKSNCGEGGEEPSRYRTRGLGRDDKNSRIKQIASGRFGVTPEYCAFADELQIKVAQGSKPGEGGQLPGHKVSGEIARLRHTQPNVTLISPPPHHDIYSIEDLAQLIFDLKQVNAFADVSVKLVAVEGVGTIAAGVVKALADVVQISGFNGGTGASPLSSIKHAGMPWELGLAETQAVLIENGLRSRVRVRVDGGFMTGRDVLIAAFLGADEYSFGTAAMIAEGCIMLRACHRDTCNVGVATQRPHLRAKFTGTPEGVAAYMLFVAEELRELLASLGLRSVDDAIGRVECLTMRDGLDERAASVDLTPLITPPEDPAAPRRYEAGIALQRPRSELGDRLNTDAYPRYGTASTSSSRTRSPTPTGPSARRSAARWRSSSASSRRAESPGCVSTVRRDRASPPSSPTACTSNWSARPTTMSARRWAVARSSSGRRPTMRRSCPARTRSASRPCSPATHASTARPAATSTSPARPASGSRCATRARPRSSKASAITAVST